MKTNRALNALNILKKNLSLVELKELTELIEDYVEVEYQKDMASTIKEQV